LHSELNSDFDGLKNEFGKVN